MGWLRFCLSKDRLAMLLDCKKKLLDLETIGIKDPCNLALAEKFVAVVDDALS